MAHEARDEALTERAQHLLRTLIETYIRDGQPVGSRALSRESGLQLSSATIRNVMADLEELGFVASPHTSAGRVPTDKGYRFFVDTLLQLPPLDEAASAEIRRQFEASRDRSTDLIATVSQLLSSATQLAGVVTVPRTRAAALTQIEFVALSENRVLAVLVFNDR
jgi:heat-inducible transcriptional repressor